MPIKRCEILENYVSKCKCYSKSTHLYLLYKYDLFLILFYFQCSENYGCICCCKHKRNIDDGDEETANEVNEKLNNTAKTKYYKRIILDFTLVQYIDESGLKCLKDILKEYNKEMVQIYFTNCSGEEIFYRKNTKMF